MAKQKPGPKRNQHLARTPSGQPSRSKAERTRRQLAETDLGVRNRRRQFGLTYRQARDPRSGSALGRLYLKRKISLDEYLAGEKIGKRFAEARRALGVRETGTAWIDDAQVDRPAENAIMCEVSQGYIEWACGAVNRARAVRRAILLVCSAQKSFRPSRAVDIVIVDDRDAPEYTEALRKVLKGVHEMVG